MRKRALHALALTIVMWGAGCASPGTGEAERAGLPVPRIGDTASYSLTFDGERYDGDPVRVTLASRATGEDRFGRDASGLSARVVVVDDIGGYDYEVLASTADRQLLYKRDFGPRGMGAQVFAEESPQWYGFPVKGVNAAYDLQRCILVGALAAPLALAGDRPERVWISSVEYEVRWEQAEISLQPTRADAQRILMTTDGGFFPLRVVLATERPFCALERVSAVAGEAEVHLASAGRPPTVPPSRPRSPFVGRLPPSGGTPAEFTLEDAHRVALGSPQVAAFLTEHPDSYLVRAQYKADAPDGLDHVRTRQWLLRFASPTGAAVLVNAQRRAPESGGPSIDEASVADTRPVGFVPPQRALRSDVTPLDWALDEAVSRGGLGGYSQLSWFVAEDPTLVGTPDESLWQVVESRDGRTRSVLLSANNGQVVAIVVTPYEP